MTNFEIKINENIEVIYNEEIYKSKIQDTSDDGISIYLPSIDGKYLPLRVGEEIQIIYYGERDKIYSFKNKVIKRNTEGTVKLLTLGKPYDIEKIQRRNFVRVNYIEEIEYGLSKDKNEVVYKSATLIDLSGGGLKFRTRDKLEEEELIDIRIKYNDEVFNIKSKVVRVSLNDNGDYSYGIEFININEVVREKIIRIVFNRMRKKMR